MSGRDPDSLKALCNELARKLVANPNRHLMEMRLRHGGHLKPAAGEANRASLGERPAGAIADPPPARAPRPISIWRPTEVDGELMFVRPEAGPLGDGFCQRRSIARRKTARRICLFGESVALGFLYAPHLTPAQVLEDQLNAVAGEGAYEVVDLSKSSESLFPLAATMKDALQLEPDGIVVFAGNNWNFQETDASPWIPVQGFRARYARALREGGVAGVRALGARLLEEKALHVLGRIRELAAIRSIPVVVIVPEVNLADWESRQPVVWRSGDDTARWHELYARAVRGLETSELAAAIEAAEQMLEIDGGTCPSAFRILATAYRALGRLDDAARAARAEVDADLMPTMCYLHCPQATTPVQELLRRAGGEHGFTIVDLPAVFAAHAGSALPGRRYFLDYCHLTAEGMRVAMAATASAVLGLDGAADLTWQALLAAVPAASAPPRAEAVAMFGAAIHSAHRLQAVSVKRELLTYWCARALAAAPEIADTMLDLIELRCSPGPSVLSPAARRNLASPHPIMLQHGLQWPNLDPELIEAICSALEQRGVPARARVSRMLVDRLAVDRSSADLAASGFFRWELYESCFAEALNLDNARHRAAQRAAQPASSFCLVASAELDLELSICARLPELEGAGPRRGTVSIEVNGVPIGDFACDQDWSSATQRVGAQALRPGLNKLTLRWPPPPPAGDAALRCAIDRLERGLGADLHPIFGEVFSLIARRRSDAAEPAV